MISRNNLPGELQCNGKGSPQKLTRNKTSSCVTFTTSAVTPQSEEPKQLRRPKESDELTVHQLIHNNVNTSVHKALYACLAEDKSLYTSTASTLFFSLNRLGVSNLPFAFGAEASSVDDIAPFQLENKLCESIKMMPKGAILN